MLIKREKSLQLNIVMVKIHSILLTSFCNNIVLFFCGGTEVGQLLNFIVWIVKGFLDRPRNIS